MKRKVILGCRLAWLALVSVLFLPACAGTSPGNPSAGTLWNTQNTGPATGGSPTPGGTLWVDPNSGLGGDGGGTFIPSNDLITYSSPTVYIPNNTHPLSTATSSQTITQAESGLMQALNGYRSRQLNGGVGGLGGIGGGGFTVPPANAFLQGHDGLTRNARANCKHFALFHPGPFAAVNPEGDAVNGGGVTPAGRLAKTGIQAGAVQELLIAGTDFPDYNTVATYFIDNFGATLTDLRWTHFGCGTWTGGPQLYHWSVILAANPTP